MEQILRVGVLRWLKECFVLADGDDGDWHLDKRVPIVLMVTMIIQTVVFAFVIGVQYEKFDYRVSNLERDSPIAIAEFTKLEAAREVTNTSIVKLTMSVDNLEKTLSSHAQNFESIERSLDRLEIKLHSDNRSNAP